MKKIKINRGDIFGGVTAGIVALPLALAFGVSSGLGPSAGLYGAIFICFFAAWLGGTSTQISGPTAPMTAVTIGVVITILNTYNGDINSALPIILAVFLLAGVIQIFLGLFGIGKYIKFIPYPVVSGFMTAIGVIILTTQLLPVLGYYPKEDAVLVAEYKNEAESAIVKKILVDETNGSDDPFVSEHLAHAVEEAKSITEEDIQKEAVNLVGSETSNVIGALKILPRALQNINWIELLLAGFTILIIYGFKRVTAAVPSTLVALFAMTTIAYISGMEYQKIAEIPYGFPVPHWDIFTEFSLAAIFPFILTAITLAHLGAIDSLLTSVVADKMTKTKHHPNKELIGQGIGNSIAAVFGGIPGAGATIRTVVNINAGGKTQLSGMISAIFLLIILLVLSPVASQIPAAVLAGILVTVGINVMDHRGLKAIPKTPFSEVLVMVVVLVLSVVWNLVYAVGIGLVAASLIFMKKFGELSSRRSAVLPLEQDAEWKSEHHIPDKLKDEIFVKNIKGPLFFGSISEFQALAKQVPDHASIVIIRMGRMAYIDQSGLLAMQDILMELVSDGKKVLFSGMSKQPATMFSKGRIIPDVVPTEHIFHNFTECLHWIQDNIAEEADEQ